MANSFSADLRQGFLGLQATLYTNMEEITDILFTEIVQNTPVDKGDLINNWYPAVGETPDLTATDFIYDKTGADSLERIEKLIASHPWQDGDNTITLTNSKPYINKIEYGSHSGQAPNGMVRLALLNIEGYISQ